MGLFVSTSRTVGAPSFSPSVGEKGGTKHSHKFQTPSPQSDICVSRGREPAEGTAIKAEPASAGDIAPPSTSIAFFITSGYQSFPTLPISLALPFVSTIHTKAGNRISVPAVLSARENCSLTILRRENPDRPHSVSAESTTFGPMYCMTSKT